MKVRDWMTAEPLTVSPRTTVADARRLMEAEGFRHLPVVDGNRLIGIISDRDVGIGDAQLRAATQADGVDDLLGMTGRSSR